MSISIGTITDEDGALFTVLAELGPTDKYDHLFIIDEEESQVADFSFGEPAVGCDLSYAAQVLAETNTSSVELPILVH